MNLVLGLSLRVLSYETHKTQAHHRIRTSLLRDEFTTDLIGPSWKEHLEGALPLSP